MESKGLCISTSGPTVLKMSYDELQERREQTGLDSLLLIDVRGRDFVGGHLVGSHHYSWEEFGEHVDAVLETCRTRRCDQVVMYCMYSQQRGPHCANMILQALEDAGLDVPVSILNGGFHKILNAQSSRAGGIQALGEKTSLVEDFDLAMWKDTKDGAVGLVHQLELVLDERENAFDSKCGK